MCFVFSEFQAVEWPLLHPEAYQRMGLPVARGVLLYGPPGCGKTTLVQAAATASRVTFLSLSGAQLYSPFVGDSERMVIEVRVHFCMFLTFITSILMIYLIS